MSANIQVFEKLIKTDHRDTQTQTEEFKGEPISAWHHTVREEPPKAFKQPTLAYPVTLQKLPNDRGSVRPNGTPVSILAIRRFKEALVP